MVELHIYAHTHTHIYITNSFSIHPSMDSGYFHVLATINNVAMNMGIQISSQITVFVSLDILPEVELLDHMGVLFIIFEGSSIVFP